MVHHETNREYSPWPHRLAVLLCCATFPLIWVGGLVTTYKAGMAVPDWPTTYGYNLFLYPWQTWVFGPFDLFIEHSHRLLGALVGFLAISFAIVTFVKDDRRWMRFAAIAALLLVIVQGLLGGARVRLEEQGLAMIHGCFGLATFAYLAAMGVVTSRFWKSHTQVVGSASSRAILKLSVILAALVYMQVVLGAMLRHVPVSAPPQYFRVAVLFHLLVAAAVVAHAVLVFRRVRAQYRQERLLFWPAATLLSLVLLQLLLGASTWVLKYGWPGGLANLSFTASFTIGAKSLLQTTVTTAHVAFGALILAVSVMLSTRVARFFRLEAAVSETALVAGEAWGPVASAITLTAPCLARAAGDGRLLT